MNDTTALTGVGTPAPRSTRAKATGIAVAASSTAVLTNDRAVGQVRDLQVGDFLDRVLFDPENPFAGAAGQGVVVLSGRVEPHLAEALRHHGCVMGPGNRHLVHARDPGLLEALCVRSGLSVFDGEWWY